MKPIPFSSRVAPINRLRPIKLWVAPWNEISMPVSDVPLIVGVDRVVR